jgi:hypothetical protein
MKLSKTAQKLLGLARQNGGRWVICSALGTGPYGGNINEGQREFAAMRQLIELGLVRLCSQHRSRETRRGYGVSFVNAVFEVVAQ